MTKNNPYNYNVLSNGIRTIHTRVRSNVEYCGVCVRVGSRNELPDTFGLAHFVEHTIFKGTQKRRSWHIINRMEAVGGELNAYTSEEVTMIYSISPRSNLARASELIADLIANSVFPQQQIDREREVVLDEIASYLDSPSEAIFDSFNDLIFAGSPLGHNILGNEQTIPTFTPQVCRNFLEQFYTPQNMVFFYMGPMPESRVIVIAERFFGKISRPECEIKTIEPPILKQFNEYKNIGTHQCHTLMGARIPGMFADKNRTFALLNNIIGGPCMNSLLNVELRERHGYVYAVDSYTSLFSDCGELTVYFGCDPEHIKPCKQLVVKVLNDLANSPISERRLSAAKKQYLGQMTVSSENHEQIALAAARATLFNGHVAPADEIIDRTNSITAEQLRQAAEHIVSQGLSVLTFG
ncbi:MAG: insulinase family protein [Muribaculum sp.]|nr:insulinase family protein [Muribaculaceae bacterium]MCM1080518.1 insulinase family protein [Muribaculum sp.]